MFDDDDVTDVSASNSATDAQSDDLTLIDNDDVILLESDEIAMLRLFGVLD